MADEDFVNFEKALRELQLTEEQLKRLVSEGEIRAVRGDNNTMKFRREEIERLKQDTGKTIQYTEESSDTLTDDLLFDEADDLEVDEEGMATAQIDSDDTFIGDDTGMTTAPIPPKPPKAVKPTMRPTKPTPRPATGKSKVVPPQPTKVSRTTAAATPPPSRSTTQTVRRTTGRSTRMRQTSAIEAAAGIGMGVTAVLILSFIVGCYGLLVWWDISNNTSTSATDGIANWAGETFGSIKSKGG